METLLLTTYKRNRIPKFCLERKQTGLHLTAIPRSAHAYIKGKRQWGGAATVSRAAGTTALTAYCKCFHGFLIPRKLSILDVVFSSLVIYSCDLLSSHGPKLLCRRACPTCGKVLGEVGVRTTSYMKKARLKRMKSVRKRRLGSTGTDPFCSSSSTVIQESNLSTDGSKKATDQGNQLLPGYVH